MGKDEGTQSGLHVIVNGKPQHIESGTSLLDLLRQLRIPVDGTAVELSGKIVSKLKYGQTILAQGQQMEIVRMVGGG